MSERVTAEEYRELLRHGTMSVGLYTPHEIDKQSPHEQDEVYIVASGRATFALADQRTACESGDVLFAPAGAAHRFEDFSDDFAVWVVFYGPAGGEHAAEADEGANQ